MASKITSISNLITIDRNNCITGFNTCFCCRPIKRIGNHCTFGFFQTDRIGDLFSNGLNLNTNPSAFDRTFFNELVNNLFCGRRRNSKSNTDIATGRGENRCINTDNLTIKIKGRPAGVTTVNGRINLDKVIIDAGTNITSTCRDNTGCHCSAKSERITDSHNPIANTHF